MGINIKEISEKGKSHKTPVTPVRNAAFSWLKKDILAFHKGFKDNKKERFFSELSVLIGSGLDVKSSMELIIGQQKKEKDKQLISGILDKILQGNTLSHAMESTGNFSKYDYYSIRVGEEVGNVKKVLEDLNQYYNKRIKQKRQLVNAFTYPGLVLFTALLAVVFMMNFIVPMFMDIFQRSNNELPHLTKTIVQISDFFSHYLGLFVFIMLGIAVVMYAIRETDGFRKHSARIVLKLPLLGKIIRMIYMEKFFQSMELLTASKVTILRSIHLAGEMIRFYPFQIALKKIESDIMHGKLLYESMDQYNLFEKRIVALIKTGEEVNQLDKIFGKLYEQYSEELEHQTGLLGSLMEPVLIIFIGILVGIILISMYLPMFQIGTTFYG